MAEREEQGVNRSHMRAITLVNKLLQVFPMVNGAK